MHIVLLAFWIIAVVALTALLARSRARAENKDMRGIEPGQGDHLIDVSYSSGGPGGHCCVTRVTRDPQAYARAFVPGDTSRR